MHAVDLCSENQQWGAKSVDRNHFAPLCQLSSFAQTQKRPSLGPKLPGPHADGSLNEGNEGETTCTHACMGPHQQAGSALQA